MLRHTVKSVAPLRLTTTVTARASSCALLPLSPYSFSLPWSATMHSPFPAVSAAAAAAPQLVMSRMSKAAFATTTPEDTQASSSVFGSYNDVYTELESDVCTDAFMAAAARSLSRDISQCAREHLFRFIIFVSDVYKGLPSATSASSDRALQLEHIDALRPARLKVDGSMEWVKAKMGRGMDTVLDESRRRCKVLVPKAAAESDSTTRTAAAAAATSAAPVAAARPNIVHWPGLKAAIESTRKQLCPWFPPGSLHAHLHTVQQYDEGDFFTLHRDTPKLPYHIITLSVDCSPPGMTHEGGDLVVGGAHIKFSGSGSFAAWFATTHHEVLPVTKGRRMSATFNIAVDPAVATAFTCDNPAVEQAVDKAAAKLRCVEVKFESERCFVLDTEYAFDPTIGVAQHIFELQGRDRLMHEVMCRAFGCGRVVLSAHQRGARGVKVLEESMVADGASYYRPERDDHRDDAEKAGKNDGTSSEKAQPAAQDTWWRVAALSLKAKKSKSDKDKKEE